MFSTDLCLRLGIEYPVIAAPMGGGMAGPELVGAVGNAGGLGILGMLAVPPPLITDHIDRVRALSDRPFGVNLVISQLQGNEVAIVLEARIPILSLSWGDPTPYVDEAHARGTMVVAQVGTLAEATRAAAAGVDAIIAQGIEAGGHVCGTTSLLTLLPCVVDAVSPIPVIAAGGIADGRGLVAMLSLGAQAIAMGTRFLASDEAVAAREYKNRIVQASAEDTVYTGLFDVGWPDAPHRVLRNKAYVEWQAAGSPPPGRRPGENSIVATVPLGGQPVPVPRYSVIPPMPGFEGDPEYLCLYAGESCSLIRDIKPAAAIVRDVMQQAETVVRERLRT